MLYNQCVAATGNLHCSLCESQPRAITSDMRPIASLLPMAFLYAYPMACVQA